MAYTLVMWNTMCCCVSVLKMKGITFLSCDGS